MGHPNAISNYLIPSPCPLRYALSSPSYQTMAILFASRSCLEITNDTAPTTGYRMITKRTQNAASIAMNST